ncbi:MAG TPA: FMN-binding negative transcriptional regulator [Marmoricola sp.]|nr:FMN-binding negative transcriptional regulator [Marmoricola sp.]
MYIPHFNGMEDLDEIRALVTAVGTAELVTVGADGYPMATLLPVIWDGERLVFHLARANQHWKSIEPGSPALAVVTGAQGYVSPSWYPAKAEHGKVVPTWNYSAVQFTGRATAHDDVDWLREAVTRLTDLHEGLREQPWAVTDAPEDYLRKQLRAIVGVEMAVERVEAKAKLSQNRSEADRRGVVDGLRRDGGPAERELAEVMERALDPS